MGVKVTVGVSKGDHSASQSVTLFWEVRCLPRQCGPGGWRHLAVAKDSVLLEAWGPIRTQRLSDHIVGLPAVFRLGDPGWPEGKDQREAHEEGGG